MVFNDFTNPQSISQIIAGAPEAQIGDALRKNNLPIDGALLDTNILLISMGERTMLIDTGWGARGTLHRIMRAEGIAATEIDTVILTHSDSDHTGGLLDKEGLLSFPNAHYVMTREAWNLWTSDSYLSVIAADWAEFVHKATTLMRDRTTLLDGDSEIVTGVRVVDAPGHREGHIALAVSSGGEELLHVADSILHPVFVRHPLWHSPIDSYPAEAAETRRRLLYQAAQNNTLIASAHLPFPGLGHVTQRRQGWQWKPVG